MASLLPNLVNNLAMELIKLNVNTDTMIKTCGTKYKDCECCLEYTNFNENLIKYKCLCCSNNYQKTLDENLKKQFFHTHKFSNYDVNRFILLLRKFVYTFEYMNNQEKVNKTSLAEK